MFHTYILYFESFDRYYIGHCENMNARLLRHNLKKVSSTKAYAPGKLFTPNPIRHAMKQVQGKKPLRKRKAGFILNH
jgi:predicted GIY-YIG superfamily endonuclease